MLGRDRFQRAMQPEGRQGLLQGGKTEWRDKLPQQQLHVERDTVELAQCTDCPDKHFPLQHGLPNVVAMIGEETHGLCHAEGEAWKTACVLADSAFTGTPNERLAV